MNKNDSGFDELLKALQKNPGVIREIVFHPEKIKKLLKSKAARKTISKATFDFLEYIAKPEDGYPIAFCYGGTQKGLCAKGTGHCAGATRPPYCAGATKPPYCPGATKTKTS